jgi:hypothetical protein
MKNKKNITLSEHFPNSIEKIVERGKIYTPSTQLHAHSLSWLVMGTSIKSGGVKPNHLLFVEKKVFEINIL